MASLVHIYMEHPDTHEFFTLGNLTLRGRFGEFSYAPDHVERNGWVPDPVNYPLRAEAYTGVVKNNGVPGFINDATPDGWGERLLQCVFGQELIQIDILLKSTNSDRMGNLMIGSGTAPPPGLGDGSAPKLNSLAGIVEDCDAIYAGQLNGAPTAHNLRQHFSSLGGARPKRTFQDKGKLILVQPRDRFDQYDLPSIEFACMTFAASKGMNVASTELYTEGPSALLVERFDRTRLADGAARIPMLSALTLLDSECKDLFHRDWKYSAVAEEMARRGVPDTDLQELFKRMCYNALAGNTDDHPRNHALIWTAGQWRLSPMFYVVPVLDEGPAQALAMAVGREGRRISRANLLSQCTHFSLSHDHARCLIDEIASWEEELKDYYGLWLGGESLHVARDAVSSARMRS